MASAISWLDNDSVARNRVYSIQPDRPSDLGIALDARETGFRVLRLTSNSSDGLSVCLISR